MLKRRFQGGMQQRHICPFGPCVLGVLDRYVRRAALRFAGICCLSLVKVPRKRGAGCAPYLSNILYLVPRRNSQAWPAASRLHGIALGYSPTQTALAITG